MQKICWLGNDYFGPELGACGADRLCHIAAPVAGVLSWDYMCARAGFEPDLVIVADSCPMPFVLGVEEFPCLSIFYSINPHNFSWHVPYAQAFDACVVTQEDYGARLVGPFLSPRHIWWLPPFAREVTGDVDGVRESECIFIDDSCRHPRREAFLHALQEQLPLFRIKKGDAGELLTRHSMVIHMGGDAPGLDFRIFEAMAAGACLITPRTGHGLEKLFVDGEHLLGFAPYDIGDALYRINFLLENPDLIQYIARSGQREVASRHLAEHRMWELMDRIYELAAEDSDDLVRRRLSQASQIRRRCLAVPYMLCASRLQGERRTAYEMGARGNFGLRGLS